MAEQRMIVARAKGEIAAQPYRVDVDSGGHQLVADEPRRAGGGDEGPSPYGLLLAALASCTAITLKMFGEKKGWPLERAIVDLRYTRGAQDSRIDRNIIVEGDLTPEQVARLAEVAERTPVTLTLKTGVEIRTELRGSAPAAG